MQPSPAETKPKSQNLRLTKKLGIRLARLAVIDEKVYERLFIANLLN